MTSKSSDFVVNSRHLCMLPWVFAQSSQDGTVRPCCLMDGDFRYGTLKKQSFGEIWNGETVRKLRLQMLADQPFEGCEGCYTTERIGGTSFRQEVNRDFAGDVGRLNSTRHDGSLPDESVPLMLDFRFSNLCNLKCRTCSPYDSTAWVPESEILLGGKSPDLGRSDLGLDTAWRILEPLSAGLRRIYILGGEPLLQADHYRFLEKLIAAGLTHVPIRYNTNLSTLKLQNWKVLDLWAKFEKIHLNLSFDGAGARGEILRKGSHWQGVLRNFELLRSGAPHVTHAVYATVSVLNAFHLPAALDEWLTTGMIQEPGEFKVNILERPRHYSIRVLSISERERLKGDYQTFLARLSGRLKPELLASLSSELNLIPGYLGDNFYASERDQFRQLTFKLDRLRGERLVSHFPELLELLYAGKPVSGKQGSP